MRLPCRKVWGQGDGERNPAAAGWLCWRKDWAPGHLRREESLRQNWNPRRSTVRMVKECLMCILCPCSLFFGPDCRKNLLREFRFCLRLSNHSCGIVPGTQSFLQHSQPTAAGFLSPGYGKVPGGRFIPNIELIIMMNKVKSVSLRKIFLFYHIHRHFSASPQFKGLRTLVQQHIHAVKGWAPPLSCHG